MLHIQIFLCYPDTIQIHSGHDSHSDIHSTFKYSYSSDTPQTRRPFSYSYNLQLQIQSSYAPDTVAILSLIQSLSPTYSCSIHKYFSVIRIQYRYTPDTAVILIFILQAQLQLRYAPDTEATLLLIQTQSLEAIQIYPRHGYHFDPHSSNLQHYNSTNTLRWHL